MRISLLLVAEALRSVHTVVTTVTTPLGPAEGRVVRSDIVVVPVLRAGLAMLEAVLQLVPSARVGHIGLQRDESTAVASRYYSKLPPHIGDSHVLMVDPMLATGGSSAAAIDLVKTAVAAVGGQGGGGRPDMAQGGGPDGGNAADALTAVREALQVEAAAA